MPDDLSPEERLLRLIKEGKKPSEKSEATTDADNVTGTPDSAAPQPPPASRIIPDKRRTDQPAALHKPQPQPPKQPSSPVTEVPSVPAAPANTPTDAPAPAHTDQPAPPQPGVAPMPGIAAAEELNPQKRSRRRHAGIMAFFAWYLSGFTLINRLLLLLLLVAIGLTFWYVTNYPAPSIAMLDIPAVSNQPADNDGDVRSDMLAALRPKPFPYFVEEIGKKTLFRLVQPPPPPKPPEPERKEPEKPKVLIENLTRHLVLQGIILEIGPPQAVIFNKKDNKSLFVGIGDTVTENVRIKSIKPGKVVLEFEDQTQELNF